MRAAIQALPWRERKVIGLYYYGEVTMKQIGAEIGVNESRVSQLHARAIRRLKESLGDMNPQQVAEMRRQLIAFAARKPTMAKAALKQENNRGGGVAAGGRAGVQAGGQEGGGREDGAEDVAPARAAAANRGRPLTPRGERFRVHGSEFLVRWRRT